jgi:hypothetical protein
MNGLLTVKRNVDADWEGFMGESLPNEENIAGVVFNQK